MKGSFTRIITIYSAIYALACGAFFAVLIRSGASKEMVWAAAAFVLTTAIIFAGYLLSLRSGMIAILDKLSLTVQSLIDGQDREYFPVFEDSLLSKLQGQVLKLSGILRTQKLRYKEEGEEMKSLITDITHQLRTPLANLNMYNGMLANEGLPPDKRTEFARIACDQTEKLTWLMDSLVKLSRLESGMIEVRAERRSLMDTVLAAIKTFYPAAEEKGLEISFEGGVPVPLLHDAKWTGEAIGNVLDNAIKYTPAGGKIKVTIERYEMFARIDIADNGLGIPEAELAKVFQRFFRGASSSDTQGVGVGLYLARKIVTEQGGYMKVSSEPGGGSVFSLFLPVDTATNEKSVE
ncbi:sensor histidine kinase [Cohnella sp.]|uniref:sensor histidine kinase n=1 Tax=Cohnella sp. TaxID=1883426 RepID=UPI003704BC4F